VNSLELLNSTVIVSATSIHTHTVRISYSFCRCP